LELKEMKMKKLFLICTAMGLLAACNSNKKSSSSNRTTAQTAQQTNNSNNVDRINEETNYVPAESKSHLDSAMEKSGNPSRKYNRLEGSFKGASGVGTGGSYAGAGYAQSRYKKKPKIKRRTFDAPIEEAQINRDSDSTILRKESTNNNVIDSANVKNNNIIDSTDVTNNGIIDSTNVSKEISDGNEESDSASTNLNSTW
jgi:hypothetical protein